MEAPWARRSDDPPMHRSLDQGGERPHPHPKLCSWPAEKTNS